jgi:ABC-type transport system substrate-binding protein
MRLHRAWTVVLGVLIASGLTSCGAPSRHAGSLRLPLYGSVRTVDPALAASAQDIEVASLLYSGLMKFSPDMHVVPELAVSIPTISNNGRLYTFTIRRDAHFADGAPCRATDVAYSIARALHIDTPIDRRMLGGIVGATEVENGASDAVSGVRVVNRLTLQIRLRKPDADFLQKLAFPVSWVVDRRVVGLSPLRRWPGRPTGTGPFLVSRTQPGGSITLAPRPHFYGSPLALRRLDLVPVRDAAASLPLYRKDSVDVAAVPPPSVPGYAGHSDFHQSNGLDAYYVEAPPADAPALSAALNRARLIQGLQPSLIALTAVVPPAVPDYVPATSPQSTADPGAGAAMHLQVAAPRGVTGQRLRDALLREWRAIRVPDATPTRVRVVHATDLLPTPDVWLKRLASRTSSPWYRYELREAGQLTNDPVARMGIYQVCEEWALGHGLVIPIASGTVSYLIKPSVQDLQVTPLGIMPDNNSWQAVSVT